MCSGSTSPSRYNRWHAGQTLADRRLLLYHRICATSTRELGAPGGQRDGATHQSGLLREHGAEHLEHLFLRELGAERVVERGRGGEGGGEEGGYVADARAVAGVVDERLADERQGYGVVVRSCGLFSVRWVGRRVGRVWVVV